MRLKPIEIEKIFETLPNYIKSTPDPKFRKNPLTYLNNKTWEDEYTTKNQQQQLGEIGQHQMFEFLRYTRDSKNNNEDRKSTRLNSSH